MGNLCSGGPSFMGGTKDGNSAPKVNQEFDFRYKNLKSLKQAYQQLISKIKLSSEAMRDAPVKLSGVGEGYSSVCACLNHGGSGVSEGMMQNQENDNNGEGERSVSPTAPEPAHKPFAEDGEEAANFQYKDRFENNNIPTLDRELAQEDYHSSQALAAAFLKVRDEDYVKFSQNVNDKVIAKVQELQKELEVVTKQGQAVTASFNKWKEYRKTKENIEKDYQKKGKSLSEHKDYADVVKRAAEADAKFKETLFDFDKKYEALLVNSQRCIRTSRDDYLDECEVYLKSIGDLVTVVD
ncbi:hypothetical protein AGDE_07341 [Angomonas deanei]|uniref:BAR domain-containing protein n=1 Tax=Angomonas deanei TaxID=59799 RepID=A0A7G2CNN6_9TRYP|nr:hypothetical protein AGDE_07341 [Angomonas deanei]CAD2220717.1 hypothetical protein, conserved [Angomonas deanei]|eukprot:EPY35443.1 hypothetical protein AGDE_07341 [Angomonas deanei]